MRKFIWLLALAFPFAGCDPQENNDQDLNPPAIDSVAINGKDHDIRLQAGDTMELQMLVSDDQALQEVKVEVHDIFDGHSHGKRLLNKWSSLRTLPVSGKEAQLNETFLVPGLATAGRYHAVVRALDATGNEAPFKEIAFVVVNGQQPTFNVTSPDFSQEVHAPKGSTFSLAGTINDPQDLEEILVRISPADHDHGGVPLVEKDYDLPGGSDASFDLSNFSVAIPANAETGYYHLEISALDGEGNYGLFKAEFHIM